MNTYKTKTQTYNTIQRKKNKGSSSTSPNKGSENIQNSPKMEQAIKLQNMADKYSIENNKNGTNLPNKLKSGIQKLSGYSMDDVKVHYNSAKPAQFQAHAYTQGTNIYLSAGAQKHLPHEAWHVVQQKQGRVKGTMQMKGKTSINTDSALEKEADVMGSKALQVPHENASTSLKKVKLKENNPIQRVWKKENDIYVWDQLKDGVQWFGDQNGNMWFKIIDPSLIKLGKYEEYKASEGKKKTPKEWDDISIFPVTNEMQIQTAFDGWKDDSGISWDDINEETLAEYQKLILNFGIKPLITQLLDHLPSEIRKPVEERMDNALGKLRLFKKEEFALRSCHFSSESFGNTSKSTTADIPTIIKELKREGIDMDPGNKIPDWIISGWGPIQGQAMGSYQCINAGSAFKGQGLHLIIHETMHNIADPNFVKQLRQNDLGDEGLNEYFARLATLTLKKHPLSKTKLSEIMGSPCGGINELSKEGTKATDGRGVYGDLMNQKNYFKINRNMNPSELIKLAEKYFLGK